MEAKEADIVINGVKLTFAQSMTLRVAMSSFRSEMSEEDALGNDGHGKFMAEAYAKRSDEIIELIFRNLK